MKDKYLLGELEDRILDTVYSYIKDVPRPFGAVFSGGFDSGLLIAITKPDVLFRVKFPYGTKFDETRYADAIAKHLGIEKKIFEIEITPENFRENFADAVKVMGEPTTHFSLVPLYILFKFMKSHGMRDVLSGEGPDEYLGGYARQIVIDEILKMYSIPELRNYTYFVNYLTNTPGSPGIKLALLQKYASVMNYGPEWVDFAKANLDKYPLQGVIGKMDMKLGQIEKMEQKMANHFGINFHYPYINDDLAEYCYKLPDDLKIRDGVTKWGFRQIAMKYLPEIMRDRVKMGGPVAPVNKLMGWDLPDFDKSKYVEEQKKILKIK